MYKVYKKDSKNKIRVTEIVVNDNTILTSSGLLNGKMKVTSIVCKPRNVGKRNETNGSQQAELEATSRYNKKLDEGYFNTLEEAQNNTVVLPMLAHSVDLAKLKFPVIMSPKLDGMRCLGQADIDTVSSRFMSRKGKFIETLSHITVPLVSTSSGIIFDAWLDGEMYAHNKDFQTNMSLIKKYREGLTEEIQYHVYDVYIPNSNMSYTERHNVISNLTIDGCNVQIVPYVVVNSVEELRATHARYLELEYEGSMIRINDVPYELNKRSHSLLKYKDFIDRTYTVVDVVPNDNTPKQGTVVCKLGSSTFKCGMKMSHKDREDMLINKHKYIGKTAEIRFFEFSTSGIPRFPVCVGFRLDK